MLKPPLISRRVWQKCKRAQAAVIFARVVERLRAWKDRRPPQRVAITEWDNIDKAQAFFKSKEWVDLGPERDKALKTVRRYAVEQRD
jgi:hypothetical protein